jgi:hypothetical protein
MQVLEQLPEGLALTVLRAAQVPTDRLLSMLPTRLHSLAIEACFPFLLEEHFLSLDFNNYTWETPEAIYAALHAAVTAITALETVSVQRILDLNNDGLLKLIISTCKSASGVRLDYESMFRLDVPEPEHIQQLGEVLSQNSSLTSLELSFSGQPTDTFNFDGLLDKLTNLQSLSLRMIVPYGGPRSLSAPQCIVNMKHLTCLHLRHGLSHILSANCSTPDTSPEAPANGCEGS